MAIANIRENLLLRLVCPSVRMLREWVAQNVGSGHLNMLSSRQASGKSKIARAILSSAQTDATLAFGVLSFCSMHSSQHIGRRIC
jgi:hypothetical protein